MTFETEFADVLDVIATSLGIAAERIFGIFVGAQAIIGILNVLCVLVSLVVACGAWWCTKRIGSVGKKEPIDGWSSKDIEVLWWLAPTIVALVVFFITWILTEIIDDSVLKILCPEYTAMKEIIGLVR